MKIVGLFTLVILISAFCFQQLELPDHFRYLANTHPENCIYKGSSDHKLVSLTFDDGPSEVTPFILDLLDKHQISATFFWQGKNLIAHHDLAKRAIVAGHEMGNHSWDHPNGEKMDVERLWKEQIKATNDHFDSLFDLTVNLYRPPFGAITTKQVKYLADRGITTTLWSLSTFDWDTERNSTHEIVDRFKKRLHPGAIVLLHDVDFDNTSSFMLKALEEIIIHGKAEGYEFVTVSNCMEANK